MTKIEGMALNVVLQLAKAELMSVYRTDKVKIIGVGFDEDQPDMEGERSLVVTACVMPEEECFKADCGTHQWVLTWDEEECQFFQSYRLDQSN